MKNFFVALCCLFLFACSGNDVSGKAPSSSPQQKLSESSQDGGQNRKIFASIEPQQANQLIQTNKNLLALDVRSPGELKEGKIAGSKLIPFWQIARGEYKVPAGQPVLLICAIGGRSYAVGKFLNQAGYPEVYNLKGGITAWKQAGLPVLY
jgi:rhodanese-related sulfurtransferase